MDRQMEREKALEMAMSQIDKQFGKGSVMKMGERTNMDIEAISTGALSLDLALGIGGLPRGRVVEVYGPESSGKSTLAMHVVAEAQRMGGICAYIDAEHAMDPIYARAIGVDVDELLISQPDTGEQALEITDMLVRSGAIDVIVIDSVAALTPRAEIEGDMGDTHVGLQARLMSQALRKLTANLNKTNTICLFINQLREKIGVMFGCLSYSTRVTLADGTQEKIGKIVNQKLPVEVLSYDPELGLIVPKKIVNWFDNGPTEDFLTLTVAKPGGNGRAQLAATPNHKIRTPGGWREAGELKVGDRVLQAVPHYLSDFQWDVIIGGLMGDGALSPSRSGHGARFRFGHGTKQRSYAAWKASLFGNVGVSYSTNAKGAVFYDVQPLPELAELRRAVYSTAGKVFDHDYLKRLTPLSLALWYMDDGSFANRSKGLQERTKDGSGRSEICIQAMEPTTRTRLIEYLADTWDLRPRLSTRAGKAVLVFAKDETAKFHALIAPFVHPSMEYKLLPRFRGRFAVEPVWAPMRQELVPLPITKIGVRPPSRATHRFDIEVEGSHNYFADGVMVHNSPETTPGGRALKFYASVRLDIRRIESIKEGVEVVGNRTRVKVVKNKCVAAGTLVFDPTTGLTHKIEDIVDNQLDISVMAVDKLGQLHARPVTAWFDQGEQDVIGLSLRDGTVLRVTPDHRILTDKGWCEAGDLRIRDRVARPRGQARPTEFSLPIEASNEDNYLSASQSEPVLAYLRGLGVSAVLAARLIGEGAGDPKGGMGQVLGRSRVQRDLLERLAEALDSEFLRGVLGEDLYYDRIVEVTPIERRRTFDLEVDEFHTFVADGVVVHNCSAPFRQAEFDITYGKGISREGSVLDVAVDLGIAKKSGAWYTYEGEQLGQGRENSKAFLSENPSVMIEIYDRVREQCGITKAGLDTPLGHGELDADDEPITLD